MVRALEARLGVGADFLSVTVEDNGMTIIEWDDPHGL